MGAMTVEQYERRYLAAANEWTKATTAKAQDEAWAKRCKARRALIRAMDRADAAGHTYKTQGAY